MNKLKFKPNVPFTQIPNVVIDSNKLSLQAKGLYCYLMSKPTGWIFSEGRISSQTKESRATISRILGELENFNMLERERVVDDKGKFSGTDYIIKGFESYAEPAESQMPIQITMDARRKAFAEEVKNAMAGILERDDAVEFYRYWTQPNHQKTKLGFELCKTWDIKARMRTWAKNKRVKINRNTKQTNTGASIANT